MVKNRTYLAAALGWMLAASLAQAQPLPDTYSVAATGEMGGPLSIKINRNGAKELIEFRNEAGDMHIRQLYDFQARRLYNVDLVAKNCTTQTYTSAFAPLNFDSIGGSAEMNKERAKDPPKVLRQETVNGIKTSVAEVVFPGGKGKFTFWFEEKHGFTVKHTYTATGKPERLLYEIRQTSYTPSPASLFVPPADCTRIGGATSATGGSAEVEVEASAEGEVRSQKPGARSQKPEAAKRP